MIYSRMKRREAEEADTWLDPFKDQDLPGTRPPRASSHLPPSAMETQLPPPPPQRRQILEDVFRQLMEQAEVLPPPRPPVIPPPPMPAPPVLSEINEEEIGLPVHLPGLRESKLAGERARSAETRANQRMHQADQLVARHQPDQGYRARVSHSINVSAWLRNPSQLRTAMVASIILGPPKAIGG